MWRVWVLGKHHPDSFYGFAAQLTDHKRSAPAAAIVLDGNATFTLTDTNQSHFIIPGEAR
ncbi:hypothetical protein PSAC2689_110062 [Paraburkholderia sacchari]